MKRIKRGASVRIIEGRLKGESGRVLYDPDEHGQIIIRSYAATVMSSDASRLRVSVEHVELCDAPTKGKGGMELERMKGSRGKAMRGNGTAKAKTKHQDTRAA